MNKNTKTALIVALSIFGAGVLIWLCVSLGVGFNYSKLSWNWGKDRDVSASDDASFVAEHVDKDIEEKGQSIEISLSYSDIIIKPSQDGKIHISYDNTEETYFEFRETDNSIVLKQRQKGSSFLGLIPTGSSVKNTVELSLPEGRDGKLTTGSASGETFASDLKMKDKMSISTVSGELTANNCEAEAFAASTVSGDIEAVSIEAKSYDLVSVSGNISLSQISRSAPVSIASTSGEVYAENVKTENMDINTISGEVTLKSVVGQRAVISTTSGATKLLKADFRELKYTTISGDISGTVTDSSEDYTVYTDTVSGRNSLSGHRGRGARTLDLSSTSGSFDIGFEK